MRLLFLMLVCCCLIVPMQAQEIHFSDTIKAYNRDRIIINTKGMNVLAAWGVANMGAAGIGYFTAKQNEWKSFHEMNFVWGTINTVIAYSGYIGITRQAKEKPDFKKAYQYYKNDKKVYLINMGLDVVYTGVGLGLVQYAKGNPPNAARYSGFGKSIVLQGIALLAFDNVMYRAHLHYNSRWTQILDELQFTGNGFSYHYTFPTHNYSSLTVAHLPDGRQVN